MAGRPGCARCDCQFSVTTLKLIPSGRRPPWPTYVPQLKESCAGCGAYVKFAKQTPALITRINAELEKFVLVEEAT